MPRWSWPIVVAVLASFGPSAVALAQEAAPAPRAPADGQYASGSTVQGQGPDCSFGPPDTSNRQTQIIAGADAQLAPGRKPRRIGEPFYVSLFFGAVSSICGGGTTALPEFIPPAGVFPAVSPQRPILWRYRDAGQQLVEGSVATARGRFGGVLVSAKRTGMDPEPWPVAGSGGALEIFFPMVSSRRLTGVQREACSELGGGDRPCPPAQAADYAQVFTQHSASLVFPMAMAPTVGLFAEGVAKPTARRTGRRLVVGTAPLAKVVVTVRAAGRTRVLRRTAGTTGTARLTLPTGSRGARIAVTAADGSARAPVLAVR